MGRNYRFNKDGKDDKEYYGFDYGYMSNASHGNEYKKGNKPTTVKIFPTQDQYVQKLNSKELTEETTTFYHHYAQSITEPQLISRYGIQGNAIKSMIKDSPFSDDTTTQPL